MSRHASRRYKRIQGENEYAPHLYAHRIGDVLKVVDMPDINAYARIVVGDDDLFVGVYRDGNQELTFGMPEFMYEGYRDTGYAVTSDAFEQGDDVHKYSVLSFWAGRWSAHEDAEY